MATGTQVQWRTGTASEISNFTGAPSEVTVNETTMTLHVHDGVTVGGFEMARADGSNFTLQEGLELPASNITLEGETHANVQEAVDTIDLDIAKLKETTEERFTQIEASRMPFYEQGEEPTTDSGDIYINGVGVCKWSTTRGGYVKKYKDQFMDFAVGQTTWVAPNYVEEVEVFLSGGGGGGGIAGVSTGTAGGSSSFGSLISAGGGGGAGAGANEGGGGTGGAGGTSGFSGQSSQAVGSAMGGGGGIGGGANGAKSPFNGTPGIYSLGGGGGGTARSVVKLAKNQSVAVSVGTGGTGGTGGAGGQRGFVKISY